jgi:hypothetical protein
MLWTRSIALALATHKCTICQGSGLTLGRSSTFKACDCVLRGIFKVCHNRFRSCIEREKHLSHVTLEIHSGPNRRGTWGRKQEEYIADFLAVSRRSLTDEERRIFRYRFLLGADWKLCCRRLKMDRGSFFHAVYRIQTRLGEVFATVEPYALFPLDEYFGSNRRSEAIIALPRSENRVLPVRPPVRFRNPVFDEELLAA